MSTLSDAKVAEARERLHDLMLGHARVQAAGMEGLVRADWSLAARIEQLRRHPLMGTFDDELLAAVASRAVDPNVEARYLAMRLRESEAEAAAEAVAEAGATSPRTAARRGEFAGLPALAVPQMEATIRVIARNRLGIETLSVQGRDSLDFHDCGVGSIRAALIEAYEEGWHAAP